MIIGLVVFVVVAGFFAASLLLRRHGESESPRPHWQRTGEVFRDPGTDRVMRVWVDPYDGSRHYVPERGW
jgi:hypothetical protein